MLLTINTEAIKVLHDKFARTHNARFGTKLVAKLVLELIDINRQVFIARNIAFHETRKWLFMGWRKADFAASIEFSFKPNIHHLVTPTIASLPDGFGLQSRHRKLLSAERVHLFANNLDDILQSTHAEWQKVINARHFFIDITSTQKQLCTTASFIGWCGLRCFSK